MSSPPGTSNITRGRASARTKVQQEHFTYDWTIADFERLPNKNGEAVWSPNFHTLNTEAEWTIAFYPQGENEDIADYVSVYLELFSCSAENYELDVSFEFSIPGIEKPSGFTYKYTELEGYGCPKFVQRSKLLALRDSNVSFKIRCEMMISGEVITEPIDPPDAMEHSINLEEHQWRHDFRQLLKESKFSDVALHAGDQTFPAHKLILAARSPVFSAMFENKGTRENITNEVWIEGMEPGVVAAMLEFLYTDQVTNLREVAHGLLEAAEMYDIRGLKKMCEETLSKTLDKENAAELLIHSDLYRCYKLKGYVLKFMSDHLGDVAETKGYKSMKDKRPGLAVELLEMIAARKKVKE